MTNSIIESNDISQYLSRKDVSDRIQSVLKERSTQFVLNVQHLMSQNKELSKCSHGSIVSSVLTATTLDLPLNQNLGFVWIISYESRKTGTINAQLQFGYKAFIQLAIRSGQFYTISATPIYDGQIKNDNPLTGFEFDFGVKSDKIIGYASYFKLLNGFEKTLYMTNKEIDDHAREYSKSYSTGQWKTNFKAMALKTVIKLLLSRYAPLSVEMREAIEKDQTVGESQDYTDNPKSLNMGEIKNFINKNKIS